MGKNILRSVLATAILDRFIHHCHFVVIKGESYRMKQSKESLKAISAKIQNNE